MKTVIKNADLILPDRVLKDGWMLVEDNTIKGMGSMEAGLPDYDDIIDADGCFLMPGMIDVHSDMIEQVLQPRSTALMDFEVGLQEAEKQLAACGITTMYHSISMYRDGAWSVKEIRKAKHVKKLANLIKIMDKGSKMINHKYHLRYEIDNIECYDDVVKMVEDGKADLISFMDHSPCQGQYRDLSVYRRHMPNEGMDITDEEFEAVIKSQLTKPKVSDAQLKELAELAERKGVAIASHDDDSVEKLMKNKEFGVVISEFPITLEVAKKAREMGYYTVLGSPNILLGGSHAGNLSAMEAISNGVGSILCSDYYPQALLRAVFKVAEDLKLPVWEACNMVTLNPAKAVKIDNEYGSLEVGKKADFLIVKRDGAQSHLLQTWVDGKVVVRVNQIGGVA